MNVANRATRAFVAHFLRAYPRQTTIMVAALSFASLAEGVGLVAFLPVLELLIDGGGEPSAASALLFGLLAWLGLPATVPSLLALIVVCFILKGGLYYVAMRQVGFTVATVGHDLRLSLLDALLRARWSHFVDQPVGRVANSISSEAHRASWGYLSICGALAELVQIFVYVLIIAALSWQLALALPLAGGAALLVFGGLVKRSRAAGNQSTAHLGDLVRGLAEILPGLKALKAMGLEHDSWPLLTREAGRFKRAQQRTVVAREALSAAYEPLIALLLALLLYLALSYTEFGFATLLLLAALFQRLMMRVSLLQGHFQSIVTNESAYFSLREQESAARARAEVLPGGAPPPPLRESIGLQKVRFRYADEDVLCGIDLSLAAGGFYCITGASGSGKTTLLDLLLGLQTPSAGRIVVDGVALDSIDSLAWRRQIGYVPQDPLLFHTRVRDNVVLQQRRVADAELERALRLADAWAFVQRLPGALDYRVGERGGGLSGGQRQRLCLARALLRRPRLLVLDEATSALDPEAEARVCANLSALRGETTVVAVSHRPGLREIADRTLHLERGLLTETAAQTAAQVIT